MPLGAFIQQIRKRFESSLPRIRILPRSGRKNQTPVLEGAAQSAADGKPEGVPDGGRGFDVHPSAVDDIRTFFLDEFLKGSLDEWDYPKYSILEKEKEDG